MTRFCRAVESDVPDIVACLSERPEQAMFPLNNLDRFGLDGADDYAPRMWISRDRGRVRDVMTVTQAGMVLPFVPSGEYEAAAAALPPMDVIGIVGPNDAARGVQAALGLAEAAASMDEDETQFAMELDALIVPDGPGGIVPFAARHREVLLPWMTDYQLRTLRSPENEAESLAAAGLDRHLETGQRVVLEAEGEAIATTAFNAALPDIVQVGGVYTPPDLRGRGFARRAVALHLAQARDRGVTRATLFASHPSAMAAYRAVGFDRIGAWTLCLFESPQVTGWQHAP